MNWRDFSNCLEVPARWFFPNNAREEAEAKAVCSGCDVKRDCYEYALTSNRGGREQYGIFGGINFEHWVRDRNRQAKRRSRDRRVVA